MSVYKVTQNDVESLTLITTPQRIYSSGSSGVTGSIKVYSRQTHTEKDLETKFYFLDKAQTVEDDNFDIKSKRISDNIRSKRASNQSSIDDLNQYFSLIESTAQKKNQVLDIERFTPTAKFSQYTLIKNNIKEVLMRFYGSKYPQSHWAYTNYNSINFFTSNDNYIPKNSVLIYPNVNDKNISHESGYASGSYSLSGPFTFDFYINPRYKTDGSGLTSYTPGTIFHLSSSYSLSLVSGSQKDENGLSEGFRLLLQLNHSADFSPSITSTGNNPSDLIFLSDDNSLKYNKWHHVVVRWGTNTINNGTGSFIIDGVEKGRFIIPSSSIAPLIEGMGILNPDVLCIGNFYEGENLGTNAQSLFFSKNSSLREGLDQLTSDDSQDEPDHYSFNHPLKAEIHDLLIKRYYVSDLELNNNSGIGSASFDRSKIAFYLPPFFVEETNVRRYVNDHGGILQTPFFEINGTTDDPFNVAMSFGVNGHYINLENFTKDFSTGRFPRLLNLSASVIDHTTEALEANYFLYSNGSVAKRNLTILPCDDGNFNPNYEILKFEKLTNKFIDSVGQIDYSLINLDNLVFDPKVTGLTDNIPEDYEKEYNGSTPEMPGLPPSPAWKTFQDSIDKVLDDENFDRGVQKSAPLTIYQRTGDPSSNQITFFNISNLYYGQKILPGSFQIKDSSISGSSGAIKITLKDDGLGNLYRADSDSNWSTQNSVGNIFYDEGIIFVKSPHLYFFGKDGFEISFKGVQNIYSQKYEILASSNHLNSSSNPTYLKNYNFLKSSSSIKDDEDFVYISGLNLHDENMNILAKARLAQPIIKRESDSILFKVTLDF